MSIASRSARPASARAGTVESGAESRAELAPDYLVLATGSGYPFPAKSDIPSTEAAHGKVRDTHTALAAADRVLLLGAGPVGIELAGETKAVWPGKQVTLGDVSAADRNKGAGAAGRQAQLVAANIRARITGDGELARYEPAPPSITIPVGPDGGAGQRHGSDDLVPAEVVSQLKATLTTRRWASVARPYRVTMPPSSSGKLADPCPLARHTIKISKFSSLILVIDLVRG